MPVAERCISNIDSWYRYYWQYYYSVCPYTSASFHRQLHGATGASSPVNALVSWEGESGSGSSRKILGRVVNIEQADPRLPGCPAYRSKWCFCVWISEISARLCVQPGKRCVSQPPSSLHLQQMGRLTLFVVLGCHPSTPSLAFGRSPSSVLGCGVDPLSAPEPLGHAEGQLVGRGFSLTAGLVLQWSERPGRGASPLPLVQHTAHQLLRKKSLSAVSCRHLISPQTFIHSHTRNRSATWPGATNQILRWCFNPLHRHFMIFAFLFPLSSCFQWLFIFSFLVVDL